MRNLTDPKGGVLSMNYWGPGQLRWVKNQLDVANREYDYDAAGRVSVFRNAGLRETMTYDAAGRQTGRRFNSGERVTQMYDALGRRTTLSDFWGVATTTYDALGRVTRESNRGLAIRYELRTCLAFPFETSALESGTTKRTRQSRAEPQGDSGCPNGPTNACWRTMDTAREPTPG